MSDRSEFDEVLEALRSGPTAAERAGETELLAAMRSELRPPTTQEATVATLRSRFGRIAVIATAGVVGVGGLAAAGPGSFLPLTGDDDGRYPSPETLIVTVCPGATSPLPVSTPWTPGVEARAASKGAVFPSSASASSSTEAGWPSWKRLTWRL